MAKHITKIDDLEGLSLVFAKASLQRFFNNDEKALVEDFNRRADEIEKNKKFLNGSKESVEVILPIPR
jgi:hypothetical protein